MTTRLTGSTDLLTYYDLIPCYQKYTQQEKEIDPTLFSFVSDLPGKTTVDPPDGYMMNLLRDPHVEEHTSQAIQPLDNITLKDAYHLREGPVPGFDVTLLGTDDPTNVAQQQHTPHAHAQPHHHHHHHHPHHSSYHTSSSNNAMATTATMEHGISSDGERKHKKKKKKRKHSHEHDDESGDHKKKKKRKKEREHTSRREDIERDNVIVD